MTSSNPRGQQWSLPAALTIAAVGAALILADVALDLTLQGSVPSSLGVDRASALAALPLGGGLVVGVVLVARLPRNVVGWLFAVAMISLALLSLGTVYDAHSQYIHDVPAVLDSPLGVLGAVGWSVGFPILLILVPLVFPDGRLLSRRWRPAVYLAAATMAISLLSSLLGLLVPDTNSGLGPLLGLVNGPVSALLLLGLMAAAVASLVIRYRRSDAEQRHQLKWFVAAVVVALGAVVPILTNQNGSPIFHFVSALAFCALPASIGVAVLKYRLYDIDVVISRALVYGVLAVLITAIYVGIVVGVGSLVGQGGRPNLFLSIVATAVVAVGFQPARERLTRVANRLVYGRRATPYEVLSEFSGRVAESYATGDVLARMARVMAEGTGARLAEVWLRRGNLLERAAAWPDSEELRDPAAVTGHLMPAMEGVDRAVPVRHQGELLGALTITKGRGETLTPIEVKLVDDLAHQAGLVLKNVGLTSDLQLRLDDLRTSRQRLVAAQDNERRKLERNLHDGAQQYLVAIKVKLGLAEMLARKDPAKARLAIVALKGDADEALETVRDLARGIYPPLLADRGLGAALEAQARRALLPVTVTTDGTGRYSQEIEAAAYFCVLEALQNVQKYAGASRAAVTISVQDGLMRFTVNDDGRGFDAATIKRGAGLTNMADRVDALGGTIEVASSPGRGTTVAGSLPVSNPGA